MLPSLSIFPGQSLREKRDKAPFLLDEQMVPARESSLCCLSSATVSPPRDPPKMDSVEEDVKEGVPPDATEKNEEKEEETSSQPQLFSGINFCLCDDLANPEEVKEALIDGGGKLVNYLTDIVTHLIADKDEHSDVTEALEIYEKPVVTPSWVFQSIACGSLLPTKAFSPLRTQLFSNIRVCPSNLSGHDIESVWGMITFYGGSFSPVLDKSVTHIISGKSAGDKYDKSLSLGSNKVKVVTPDWIIDSVKNRSLCDEDLYHPKLLITPGTGPSTTSTEQSSEEAVSQQTSISQSTTSVPTVGPTGPRVRLLAVTNNQSNQGVRLMNIQRTPGGHVIRPPSAQAALGFSVDTQPLPTTQNQHQSQPRQVFLSLQQQPQIRSQQHKGEAKAQQQQLQRFQFVQNQNVQQDISQQGQPQQSQQQMSQKPPNQVILQQRIQPPVHTLSANHNLQQQQQHQQMIIQQQPRMSGPPGQVMHLQRAPNGQLIRVPNQQQMVQHPMQQQQPINQQHPQQMQMQHQYQQHVQQPQQHQMYQQMMGQQQMQSPQVQRVPQVRMMSPMRGQMMRGPPPQNQVVMNADGSQQRIYFRQPVPNQTHEYVQHGHQLIRQPVVQQQQFMGHQQPQQQQWSQEQEIPNPQGMMLSNQPQQHPQMMQWHQQQQPQQPMMSQRPPQMIPQQIPQQHQAMQRARFPQPQGIQMIRQGPPSTPPGMVSPGAPVPQSLPTSGMRMPGTPTANIIPSSSPSRLIGSKGGSSPSTGHPMAPAEPVVDKFYTHESSAPIGKEVCLVGCVIYLYGFEEGNFSLNDAQRQFLFSRVRRCGGEIETTYGPRVTHVVTDSLAHSVSQQALREGKRLVNLYWLDAVMRENNYRVPWKPWHFPKSVTQQQQESYSKEIITSAGFSIEERQYIRELCYHIGARYTTYLSSLHTVLVCRKIESDKYTKAKEWLIPVVSAHWLVDAFLGINEASRKPYGGNLRHRRMDSVDPFELDLPSMKQFMIGWTRPIQVTAEDIKTAQDIRQKEMDSVTTIPSQSPNHKQKEQSSKLSDDTVNDLNGINPADIVPTSQPGVDYSQEIKKENEQEQENQIPLKNQTESSTNQASASINDDSVFTKPIAKKPRLSSSSTTEGVSNNTANTNGIPPPPPLTLAPFIPPSAQEHIFKVLFTGIKAADLPSLEEAVKKLGARVTVNPLECTHIVVEKPLRTVKFLCGMSHTSHIIHRDWVEASRKACRFLPEDKYSFISINEALKRRNSLPKTTPLLFSKMIFYITLGVKPDPDVLIKMIESAGGIGITQPPTMKQLDSIKGRGQIFVVVSCSNDRFLCDQFLGHEIRVVHPEFVMTSLFRQQIDYGPFELKEGETFSSQLGHSSSSVFARVE